ncbi:hypothetical protein GCM10023206_06870 [Acinetobacter puyangensis]|uniref:Baseplate J-like protein n=1 Tax=Acinetobacter puyangensis TaxID=1096779 RepID=A0A240E647_9GAMM|nr:hypothetical protein [Acinetobacter puyangensis]SNX44234.1 hypothetical protein SAMN05421731_102395 [Acinetobacter puyangensis]
MLTQAEFETKLVAQLSDSDILQRYNAGDPIVIQQIRSMAAYLSLMSREIDIATLEPFIKTRDRSIIADASNKNILPTATACQHQMLINNNGNNSVSLSQGREIEDNSGGRPWRLLQSVTIAAGDSATVIAEQSTYREVSYTVPMTEVFHQAEIQLQDDMSLCVLSIFDDDTPTPNQYALQPRWMNVDIDDYAVNIVTDSLRRLFVQFGDSERAGRTAKIGEVFTFGITETYGYVDTSRLKDASLVDINNNAEQKLTIKFISGGVIRAGSDPLNINQLRVLSSYPSLYDENAVYLGNFDYLVRKKFMSRCHFISVWNENLQDRYYGATYQDINHLHVAVVAQNQDEQSSIIAEISQLIGHADNLYQDRVITETVEEKKYALTISGQLAAVHDIDSVTAQIKALLVEKYGRTTLSASRWLVNGFNKQEISTLLRNNISAFQDRISDFSLIASSDSVLPHQWLYMSAESININLERTADSIGTSWIL